MAGEIDVIQTSGGGRMEKNIALVLTDPVRDVNMTVAEVVAFGRYPYLGWNVNLQLRDKQLVSDAIEKVRITDLAYRKLHELSDGQLQMTMIAKALAQDTPIIILDEPTAHLDLNNRVEIMRLLRDLAKDMKKAILIATHELDLALQTADVIWLTGRNKNIIKGIPEDLVLDGSFDETFAFKGFDLKTGRVQHQQHQRMPIVLDGEGYYHLWTKNALERNGYAVSAQGPGYGIKLSPGVAGVVWESQDDKVFTTLAELLAYLRTLSN
jgi:iron complex transport system ATP-binding protein